MERKSNDAWRLIIHALQGEFDVFLVNLCLISKRGFRESIKSEMSLICRDSFQIGSSWLLVTVESEKMTYH